MLHLCGGILLSSSLSLINAPQPRRVDMNEYESTAVLAFILLLDTCFHCSVIMLGFLCCDINLQFWSFCLLLSFTSDMAPKMEQIFSNWSSWMLNNTYWTILHWKESYLSVLKITEKQEPEMSSWKYNDSEDRSQLQKSMSVWHSYIYGEVQSLTTLILHRGIKSSFILLLQLIEVCRN